MRTRAEHLLSWVCMRGYPSQRLRQRLMIEVMMSCLSVCMASDCDRLVDHPQLLRQTARPKLVLNTELQRTMDLIDAVAERYAIPLPEPSSASKLPDPQGPTAHGS